jgi:predicted TIM-barrel fold metal-dependent hydrolase
MWYNPIMVWLLHSPLHGMLSGSMMVIEYKGKKSGRTYHLPVGYKRIGENLLTVSYKRRTWWRNLRGGVHVNIRLQGKDVSGQAEVVEDEHGVAEGLMALIDGNSRTAHMFGIPFNTNDQPEPESLKQAASERVIVRTILV